MTSVRNILMLAGVGLLLALIVAFLLNRSIHAQPPAFQPAANPYAKGIYANGLIESDQASGENINIQPEVSGPVTAIFVQEGQPVRAGQPILQIDPSVQKATAEQQRLQAKAAQAQLRELKAEPRHETLDVAAAQLDQARANLRTLADQRDKVQRSAALDPRSVSREALDSAVDAAKAAETAVAVAQRQLDLTRAGAWRYDVENQTAQAAALTHAYEAGSALLAKYLIRAPSDGVVLALNAARGGYVSPQGTYDAYTQTYQPIAVLQPSAGTMAVRCYVDEILLGRLPKNGPIEATMIVRGTDLHVPLQFVRIQPYVSPKIQLSDQRQERVDVRVLPVIFRFRVDPKVRLYPGQLVDVYIRE